MENFEKLCNFSEKYLIENKVIFNLVDKKSIITQFALHIEYIMFNILSMMCLIALLNTHDKITETTLQVGKKYIEDSCDFKYQHKNMNGGNSLGCATFLGANEQMYNANNPSQDILTIDFNGDIAKPQIGGSKKTKKLFHTIINKYINEIIEYHGLKASKEIKKGLYNIILFHIDCFKNILRSKKKISPSTIKNIIQKHKILKPMI